MHAFIILLAILSALFIAFPFVILLLILHRLHIHFFGDCILTIIQKQLGFIKNESSFLQCAVKKIFRKNINLTQCYYIDYSIALITFGIASTKYIIY